jgi:hypothetical protein
VLETLRFPAELGRCHGTPLVFFDTNVLIDARDFAEQTFTKPSPIYGVICDFIQGEILNLKKGSEIFEVLEDPNYCGFYFETTYNSRDGSKRSLQDMPTTEMMEAVLAEYDKKLDPSGMQAVTKEAKRASVSKSKFVDFSLLTVATICAFRRKRQSIIVSRDRWIKLSCKSLETQFKLPIYCYDQWNYSTQEILSRAAD